MYKDHYIMFLRFLVPDCAEFLEIFIIKSTFVSEAFRAIIVWLYLSSLPFLLRTKDYNVQHLLFSLPLINQFGKGDLISRQKILFAIALHALGVNEKELLHHVVSSLQDLSSEFAY